jgi:hypothetical protein
MSAPAKRYNTNYKKRVDVERDTYLPRLSPKEIIQCSGCGAFYYRRHWTLTRPNGFNTPVHAHPVFCPACRKIRERFPSGELQLLGVEPVEKREIVRLLRNEEERARQKNPLERIMHLSELNEQWKVETTTEKLAQRLGRSIKKARGGKLKYKWGHNNKFVRVVWQKLAE